MADTAKAKSNAALLMESARLIRANGTKYVRLNADDIATSLEIAAENLDVLAEELEENRG